MPNPLLLRHYSGSLYSQCSHSLDGLSFERRQGQGEREGAGLINSVRDRLHESRNTSCNQVLKIPFRYKGPRTRSFPILKHQIQFPQKYSLFLVFLARFWRFLLSTTLSRRRTVIVGCIEIDQNHVKAKPSVVAATALSSPALPPSLLTTVGLRPG